MFVLPVTTTYIYTGQIFIPDTKAAFAADIDDGAWMSLDGTVLFSGAADAPVHSAVVTIGLGPNGDGWHNIEIRVCNNTGPGGANLASGFTNSYGFGYAFPSMVGGNWTNVLTGTDNNGADYLKPINTNPAVASVYRIAGATNIPNAIVLGAGGGAIDSVSPVTFSGSVSGTGSLTKTSTGTAILTGTNTYSGGTTVSSGTLGSNNVSALGTLAAVTVNSIATLSLGVNQTISALAGTGTVTLNGNALTVGGIDNLSSSFGGVIADGTSTGTFGLAKVGSGTLTLTGANTYTGLTTVSAGSLLVNGSLNTTGTVSVVGTGILGGTGTVGNVTNSGIVNPGVPGTPGALTVAGNLTLGPGSLVLDLTNTNTYDRVIANGGANITGTSLSLNIGTGVISNGDSFTILDVPAAGAVVTGTFVNLPTSGSTFTVGSQIFSIDYAGGPNHNDVVLTAVASGGAVQVTSTTQNGGIAYVNSVLEPAQHSMVENLVYSFSSAISLSPSNFTITGINGTTAVPTLNISSNGPNTVWTVTFTGTGVNTATHSIGDGEYHVVLGGVSGLVSNTYDFFRLMGDMDGNGQVDITDFSTMVGTFLRATNDPAYLGADDLDGDGTIGIGDISQLVGNFLHSVPTPLPH